MVEKIGNRWKGGGDECPEAQKGRVTRYAGMWCNTLLLWGLLHLGGLLRAVGVGVGLGLWLERPLGARGSSGSSGRAGFALPAGRVLGLDLDPASLHEGLGLELALQIVVLVEPQLRNALQDVGLGRVRGGLLVGDSCQLRVVPVRDLHDRGHVDDAVEQVVDDSRELAQHEEPVHVDRVAREHALSGLRNPFLDVGEQLLLDLFASLHGVHHLLREAALPVVLDAPRAHLVQHAPVVVHYALVPLLVHDVQFPIRDDAADLDDVVVDVVQAGHLTVDPDNWLEERAWHSACRLRRGLRAAADVQAGVLHRCSVGSTEIRIVPPAECQ